MKTISSFHESQRFTQAWLWLLLLVTFVYSLVRGGGSIIHIVLVFAALVLLFILARLDVRVDGGAVYLRFFPFHLRAKRFGLDDIVDASAVTYSPIAHYGGWGIKYGFGRGWAYNVRGNRGVKIQLKDGRTVLIGSQRADALAAAIRLGRAAA